MEKDLKKKSVKATAAVKVGGKKANAVKGKKSIKAKAKKVEVAVAETPEAEAIPVAPVEEPAHDTANDIDISDADAKNSASIAALKWHRDGYYTIGSPFTPRNFNKIKPITVQVISLEKAPEGKK